MEMYVSNENALTCIGGVGCGCYVRKFHDSLTAFAKKISSALRWIIDTVNRWKWTGPFRFELYCYPKTLTTLCINRHDKEQHYFYSKPRQLLDGFPYF